MLIICLLYTVRLLQRWISRLIITLRVTVNINTHIYINTTVNINTNNNTGQPRPSTTLVRLGLNAAAPGAPIELLHVY